jgi:hypothetical protein
MAANTKRNQNLLDDFVLADDYAPELGQDIVADLLESRYALLKFADMGRASPRNC